MQGNHVDARCYVLQGGRVVATLSFMTHTANSTKDATLRTRIAGLRNNIVASIINATDMTLGAANYLDACQVVTLLEAMLDDRATFNGTYASNAFAHAELRARRVADGEQHTVMTILGYEWDATPSVTIEIPDAQVDPTGDVTVKHVRRDGRVLYVTDNMGDSYNWTPDIVNAARFKDAVKARDFAKNIVGVGISINIEIVSLPPVAVLKLWADVEWQQCFLHCRPAQGILCAMGDPATLDRPATLLDVVDVIATDVRSQEGGAYTSYEGVFKLKDGRYLFVNARRHLVGWQRDAGHQLTALTLQELNGALSWGERQSTRDPILKAVKAQLALTPFT